MLFAISRKSSISPMKSNMTKLLLVVGSILALGNCEELFDTENPLVNISAAQPTTSTVVPNKHLLDIKNSEQSSKYASDMEELKSIAMEYIGDVLNREK